MSTNLRSAGASYGCSASRPVQARVDGRPGPFSVNLRDHDDAATDRRPDRVEGPARDEREQRRRRCRRAASVSRSCTMPAHATRYVGARTAAVSSTSASPGRSSRRKRKCVSRWPASTTLPGSAGRRAPGEVTGRESRAPRRSRTTRRWRSLRGAARAGARAARSPPTATGAPRRPPPRRGTRARAAPARARPSPGSRARARGARAAPASATAIARRASREPRAPPARREEESGGEAERTGDAQQRTGRARRAAGTPPTFTASQPAGRFAGTRAFASASDAGRTASRRPRRGSCRATPGGVRARAPPPASRTASSARARRAGQQARDLPAREEHAEPARGGAGRERQAHLERPLAAPPAQHDLAAEACVTLGDDDDRLARVEMRDALAASVSTASLETEREVEATGAGASRGARRCARRPRRRRDERVRAAAAGGRRGGQEVRVRRRADPDGEEAAPAELGAGSRRSRPRCRTQPSVTKIDLADVAGAGVARERRLERGPHVGPPVRLERRDVAARAPRGARRRRAAARRRARPSRRRSGSRRSGRRVRAPSIARRSARRACSIDSPAIEPECVDHEHDLAPQRGHRVGACGRRHEEERVAARTVGLGEEDGARLGARLGLPGEHEVAVGEVAGDDAATARSELGHVQRRATGSRPPRSGSPRRARRAARTGSPGRRRDAARETRCAPRRRCTGRVARARRRSGSAGGSPSASAATVSCSSISILASSRVRGSRRRS